MSAFVIKHGKVFTNGRFEERDLFIENGLISAVRPKNAVEIDGRGKLISRAFCDLHVHLREPGFEYKETIKTGSMAGAAGGYGLICAMPNLDPVPDCAQNLARELDIIKKDAVIGVLPYGSLTVSEKGERLSDIENMSLACGFSDDGKGVQRGEMMEKAMRLVKKAGSFISAHCEDESLLPPGGALSPGAAAKWGAAPIPPESEYEQVERDIALAEKTGCRYHVCHVSSAETVRLIRQARKRGAPVSCEITPHHACLCEDDISENDGRFKMNPPLRTRENMNALIEAMADGTISAIATDHAPHSKEEKSRGLAKSAFGVVGLETAFAAVNTHLVRPGRLSIERVFEMLLYGYGLLGLERELVPGSQADVVVIDPDAPFCSPGCSKGDSSPFDTGSLIGRVEMNLYKGKPVYDSKDR